MDGPDGRLLVDCGLFQGRRELRRRNWEPLPVDPHSIGAAVLTHAHLDHCGYLPVLARDGWGGPVLATAATCDLAALVLRDSAHLQEEDARYAAGHGLSKHDPPRPLYDEDDVSRTVRLLTPTAFGAPAPVPGGEVVLRPAGHILGSSVAELRLAESTVVFSGDLGRAVHPLLHPPAPRPGAEVVVVESTYGDRRHPPDETDRLGEVVTRTVRRGGSVLVPAFALDRTEVVLSALQRLRRAGGIPPVPVFVDSPMALAALDVYRRAITERADDLRAGPAARPVRAGLRAPGQDRRGVHRAQRPEAAVRHRVGVRHGVRRPGRAPPGSAGRRPTQHRGHRGVPGAGHAR